MKKKNNEENDDLEDILNYECTEDVSRYEEELKARYGLLEGDSSEEEAEPTNIKSSFSSLLNILTTMRKTAASKNFSESLARAAHCAQFGSMSGRLIQSEMDLSDICGSSSHIRDRFESGEVFVKEEGERKRNLDLGKEDGLTLDTFSSRARDQLIANGGDVVDGVDKPIQESVTHVKKMFEKGFVNQNTVKEDTQRSGINEDNCKAYGKEKNLLEHGRNHKKVEVEVMAMTEKDRIQRELEELREASRLSSRFRLERGSDKEGRGLKRSNSCRGVFGEEMREEFDEDTLKEVSMSQRRARAMFEQQTAPKITFGGGNGSNFSLNSSEKEVNKPVARKVAKTKDERKWVLESINKYFNIIVEEEEEEIEEFSDEEDTDNYSDEGEGDSSYEYSDEEATEDTVLKTSTSNYKSTWKMRGLVSSVVSKISGSEANLATPQIVSNLKAGLGSRINVLASNSQLDLSNSNG